MKRFVDVIAMLTVLALLGGVALHFVMHWAEKDDAAGARRAVQELEREVRVRAGSGDTEVNARGWPVMIDPAWFEQPPRNRLLDGDRPWIEIATLEQAELKDPPVRVAATKAHAGFWYNPYQGIVRARVPLAINDQRAVAAYNAVNEASITAIVVPLLTERVPASPEANETPAEGAEQSEPSKQAPSAGAAHAG